MTAGLGHRVEGTEPRDDAASFDELYARLWWPMLRVAYALLDEVPAAEDVVQDAFAGLHRKWDSIRAPEAAVGYLRVSVVNGARSALRKRLVTRRALRFMDDTTVEPADAQAMLLSEHQFVRDALARLPERQREVLTLRYVAELSDLEIADATGLSHGGVRSAASRGMAALRDELGGQL